MNRTASEVSRDDRAWVEVDLAAIVKNARRVAASAGTRLLPMVKANGYGLGAVPVARALEAVDPWGFGVATLEEGAELRRAGISRPVLLFTPMLPEWVAAAAELDLTPVLCDVAVMRHWIEALPGRAFHVGVDTGMARAGLAHDDHPSLAAARDLLAGATGYDGICTHFHSAETDPSATTRQWERLQATTAVLGRRPPLLHAANSAAALADRHFAGDLVRPGIFLYGGRAGRAEPERVATFRARVVAIRTVRQGETVSYGATWRAPEDTVIATVAAGYADGIPRSLSDAGVIQVGGERRAIRGRVTMDMTLVDVGTGTERGAVATIFGDVISLDEQAHAAGTISYELLTRLGSRVDRRYTT